MIYWTKNHWSLPMVELREAVLISYKEWCGKQYAAGWEAQEEGKDVPDDATEMFRDGWSDAYVAIEMISKRG